MGFRLLQIDWEGSLGSAPFPCSSWSIYPSAGMPSPSPWPSLREGAEQGTPSGSLSLVPFRSWVPQKGKERAVGFG